MQMRRLITILLAISASLKAEPRVWTEIGTGKTLVAELVSADGENVTLKRKSDGRHFTLTLDSLSDEDHRFLAEATVKTDRWEELAWKSPDEIPASGETKEGFEPVDEAILKFMTDKGIGAAVAAVSKDGKIIYERAFGFQDPTLEEPLEVGATMRLASISKPITAAVVRTLIRESKLKNSDTVWELLKLQGKAPSGVDPRWKDVTVQHLLEHKGGWDREANGDVSFKARRIAREMGVDLDDVTFEVMLEWMLRRPLDFEPGSREVYCNFGYSLLAHLCANVSGTSWSDLLKATVGKEANMPSLHVSSTDIPDRAPGEIWYHYHPEYREKLKMMPMRMEMKIGSAAIACSAADLCRFLETYWLSGKLRSPGARDHSFFGSMPGTTSVCRQRKDGVSFAVITNRRDHSDSKWNEELKDAVEKSLDTALWKSFRN